MTWRQFILGAAVLVVAAAVFVDAFVDMLIAHPNGFGLLLAAIVAGSGVGAVRSILRDRL